jgi:oxygen-independent coproporphyrinogen-3 oxidase
VTRASAAGHHEPIDSAERLRRARDGSPYVDYLYSYPHKTAHRRLDPPVALEQLWRNEDTRALFAYVHLPFCRARCGYCNLFTQLPVETTSSADDAEVCAQGDRVERYLATLRRQMAAYGHALGSEARFARLAIGGGTPSLLDRRQLTRLFDDLATQLGITCEATPTSFELAPDSTTFERVAVLRERGVERASIGVQSFVDDELRSIGRDPARAGAERCLRALELLRHSGPPRLNIDLIYGIEGQDQRSFSSSLERALCFEPEELYLYPLYVRPLTGLARRRPPSEAEAERHAWDRQRLALYRLGRERLLAAGYSQRSMRCFQRDHLEQRSAPGPRAPSYSCQRDGMVGLGCGARSYTRTLHTASDYAVGLRDAAAIVDAWTAQDERELARAHHGITLDDEDQRRRFVILGLLAAPGLDLGAYRERFGAEATDELPELRALLEVGLLVLAPVEVEAGPAPADRDGALHLRLTTAGLERSDAIGPALRSARVEALMCATAAR